MIMNLDKPPLYDIFPPSSGTGLGNMAAWGCGVGARAVYDVGVVSSYVTSGMVCAGTVVMGLKVLGLRTIVTCM